MALTIEARPRLADAERTADGLTDIHSYPSIPCLDIAEENGVAVFFTDFGKDAETVSGLLDFSKSRLYVKETLKNLPRLKNMPDNGDEILMYS